jgi:hypothetical protein
MSVAAGTSMRASNREHGAELGPAQVLERPLSGSERMPFDHGWPTRRRSTSSRPGRRDKVDDDYEALPEGEVPATPAKATPSLAPSSSTRLTQ